MEQMLKEVVVCKRSRQEPLEERQEVGLLLRAI